MALTADSGAIFALYDKKDRHHAAAVRALDRERGPIVIPSAILGELDYLLRQHLGIKAELDRCFSPVRLAGADPARAVMLPHAGWRYCGDLIAATLGRVNLDNLFIAARK